MNIQFNIINPETIIKGKLYLSLKKLSLLFIPPQTDDNNNNKKAITGATAKHRTPTWNILKPMKCLNVSLEELFLKNEILKFSTMLININNLFKLKVV